VPEYNHVQSVEEYAWWCILCLPTIIEYCAFLNNTVENSQREASTLFNAVVQLNLS
jgi:hypothetical protein